MVPEAVDDAQNDDVQLSTDTTQNDGDEVSNYEETEVDNSRQSDDDRSIAYRSFKAALDAS